MRRWFINPIPIALGAVLAATLLLVVPLRLPIGGNHWDIVMHLDGAYRIGLGQVPHRDFFAPSGALPYAALAAAQNLFPQAHPLLAGQIAVWVLALVIALFGLLRPAQGITPGLAGAILLPLAVFGLMPVNAIEFYPQPGFDAIGLYNRQAGFLLYALLILLVATRRGRLQGVLAGVTLSLLFIMKINAFIAGVVLMGLAWVLGFVSLSGVVIAGGVMAGLTALLQIGFGLPLAYLSDLADMVRHNAGRGLSRLMTLLSVKFGTVAALALTALIGLWLSRQELARVVQTRQVEEPALDEARAALFLAGALPVAVWCESQNTGSQEFLFIWPVLALLAAFWISRLAWVELRPGALVGLACLAAASLSTAVVLIQRSARAGIGAMGYAAIGGVELAPLGRSSTKPEALQRARTMLAHYEAEAGSYRRLAERGEMPEAILYSSIDYQALYQLDLAGLMAALSAEEQRRGRRFATVFTLDAADPVPLLTGRKPVPHLTVSFDPTRGFPVGQHDRLRRALTDADAVLRPLCPETPARIAIEAIVAPELARRERVSLAPCWEAYLRR